LTRKQQIWLASCHTQHLRTSRIKRPADACNKAFSPSARLGQVIKECSDALQSSKVVTARTEDSAKIRPGLWGVLLDIAGYSASNRDKLLSAPDVNKTPTPALVTALLEVIGSDLNDNDARMKSNKA
jgi:hypothetical protein